MPSSPKKPASNHPDTPARLLRAGLELFGTRDFDDVTTRQLADRAGVNLAAIPYHFGTKENVYLAVAEHIIDTLDPQTTAAVHQLDQLLRGTPHVPQLLNGLGDFIQAFAHEVLGVPDAALRASFILREQFRPSAAFDVLYDGFMRGMHVQLSRLYACLLNQDPASPEMLFRAQCLIGQILAFRMGREVLVRRLGTGDIDAREIAGFIAAQNIQALQRELATAHAH